MSKPMQFEQSIAALEAIVMQLEKGDLSLDESLKQFEAGIALARKCQETLSQAEQTIERLAAANQSTDDPTND